MKKQLKVKPRRTRYAEGISEEVERAGISNQLQSALAKAKSKHRLALDLGIRYQTVLDWYRGAKPSPHYLDAIQSYLEEQV